MKDKIMVEDVPILRTIIFLVGGVIYSAWKYAYLGRRHARFLGNVFIVVGALLPGIGGTFTRMGYVEVLYVPEMIGLAFLFGGYLLMQNDNEISIHLPQRLATVTEPLHSQVKA
jgi:hypothetical protein